MPYRQSGVKNRLSGFDVALAVGRVNGVVILSVLRPIDYQARDVAKISRRIRLIFP